jgi:hypothetical protein
MVVMHYEELFEKHKLFKDYDDKWYNISREKTDWENLHNLSVKEIKDEVIWFLNKWGCRIGPQRAYDIVAKGIKGRSIAARPFLEVLNEETLEDINFDKMKEVGRRQLSNFRIIHHIFSMFCDIRYRFRWVATSKVLHMIIPKLFVMWDNDICAGYLLSPSASSYAYKFMPLMKQEANEAIVTYMNDNRCDRKTAIEEITSACDGKSIAKLVDEYNWIRFRKKLDCGR